MGAEESIKAIEKSLADMTKVVKALAKASVQTKADSMKTVCQALDSVGWKNESKEVAVEWGKSVGDKVQKDCQKLVDDVKKASQKALSDKELELRLKAIEVIAIKALETGIVAGIK
jgi:hypothetical protein